MRRRYDTLNLSYLTFLAQIVRRCAETDTPLSFCGEDAGRPVEAVALAAMGLRTLSMRPASIGPVKSMLRRVNLDEARAVIEEASDERPADPSAPRSGSGCARPTGRSDTGPRWGRPMTGVLRPARLGSPRSGLHRGVADPLRTGLDGRGAATGRLPSRLTGSDRREPA